MTIIRNANPRDLPASALPFSTGSSGVSLEAGRAASPSLRNAGTTPWSMLASVCLLLLAAAAASAQTAFVDFNTVGQYTNNFNPWNDNGAGADAGNYAFTEGTNVGVNGSGGVNVFQSTDTTASYKSNSWNFATNGATVSVSVMLQANGQSSANKVQIGFLNSATNGFNSNTGVAFESFRFVPTSTTVWSLREQYRTGNTNLETTLGNINVTSGHWYKFVVGLTNTGGGGTGNYSAGCAIYDYNTSGLSPGANIVGFSTVLSHTNQDIAKATVFAGIRGYQNAGISAWDNFLVFTTNSLPVITLKLANTIVAQGNAATFNALADGPGTISYAWYTNGIVAAGATSSTYTTPPVGSTLTNVMVVASNARGSVSNSATVTVVTATLPQVATSPATNVTTTTATLGGQVLSTGGVQTTVTLFYGTTDGGTNPAAWAQSIGLGPQTGAFSQAVAGLGAGTTYFFTAEAVNAAGAAWATPSRSFSTSSNMTPIALSGFNLDVVIENTAAGPPYSGYASELNPGEGTCFYQQGLAGTSFGLPASGVFNSVIDGTTFQFQPYTASNALVMSSDTGISSGTLSLLGPASYSSISLIANSASASPTSTGTLTINFADGSTLATNFNAADWFFNPGFALQGVDRITIANGGTGGGPTDPRFYQTTINLGALGLANKSIVSLTFGQATGSGATAVYAVSGLLSGTNSFTLAVVTNLPASGVQSTAATLNGQVLSTGGFAPTVTLFYGPSNGGTNAGAWANSISLGVQTNSFSQTVTGLAGNTTYYYAAQAVNFAGTTWATPSQSFTTLPVSLAQVTNAPATAIGATLATLNGQVLSTGGQSTTVILYYGLANGGTNAGAWGHSISLGVQSGLFAQTLSGLSSNTTYYFTAQVTNSLGVSWAAPSLSFTTGSTNPISTQVPVLTYHNDNTRQGANTNETTLTPANVNTNTFGKLFSYPVDGYVYAQPLIMTNVAILGKGTHNVVVIVTEHESVYAFDADSNLGLNSGPLWQTSFLGPGVTTVPSGDLGGTTDITPEIGITSTPVIDPVTGTIYVEAKTKEGTIYVHRLHALDITSGLERTNFNSPALIAATNYPGTGTGGGDTDGTHVLWNPLRELNRPALTLVNGVVYVAYASHGDGTPYHGWLFAFNATNVSQQISVYNSTPYGGLGGFWQAGGGPAVDANGFMYFQTGNGSFNASGPTFSQASNNFAMSVLKFALTNGITLADYFAPSNAVALSGGDQDLGSSAPIVLPDSAGSAAHRHLLVGGGKTAPIYIMDRDNLGNFTCTSCSNNIVQQWNGGPGGDRDTTPAFFNNTLYIIGSSGAISAFTVSNAVFNTTPVNTPDTYANKGGATACVSANGTSNGIVWAIANAGGQSPSSPAVLRAYNATNIAQELYSSDQLARDAAGNAVKFIVPTIANGKVYVGAQFSVAIYGTASSFVTTPTISPNGGSFVSSVTVTLSDATPSATIYYTLDGTTPTTNSLLYTAPFVLTNSVEVQAIAVKPGSVNSGIASAGFVNTSAIGNGTGLLAYYWSNMTSVAFTNAAFNTAPTLTRTDLMVNFNWTNTPPPAPVGPSNFAVRWIGSVQPQFNETYTFKTFTDAGVVVWVNGQLLINQWVNQNPTLASASIPMVAQQRYTIEMKYFYASQGAGIAQLSWSSPSTPLQIIPQSQLYPVTNPPPAVALTSPTNGSAATATATMTIEANADALYNNLNAVTFYANGTSLGSVSNSPYDLTVPGVAAGSYVLTAVATDGSGLSSTSAPVTITVTNGSGLPYGLTNLATTTPFFNMPHAFDGSAFGSLPPVLSQTGVFTNTPGMTPYGGLIPYAPNVALWSDGALKTRYVAVPNNGAPYTPAEQISFALTGNWSFPAGTVFVKTFQLLTNQSDPTSLHRLETRLLVRDTNGAVYGVTYKWRPDNSEADLLMTSSNENIAITTPSGVATQTWYYPSPADCLKCHTPVANYVLGLSTRQLNGNFGYPGGTTDNQLRTLNRLGLLFPAIDEGNISNYYALSALTNQAAPLVNRARSYLDANCVQCHQPGGSGPTFDARYDTPLTNQNIIFGVLAKGNLGYDNAYVVTPKDIYRSVLYDRMNTLDDTVKMPPLARNLIDTNAVAVMAAWINSLPGTPAELPPTINPAGGTFAGSVSVTLVPPDTNATLYYTLDGTLPTTNSSLYTGPFVLTSNAVVEANAFATGSNNSVAATAIFTVNPALIFTGLARFTNGAFQLQLNGTAGKTNILLGSTDLAHWIPISTNVPLATPFFLTDPGATNFQRRFYRVQQFP